jgi:hypothetical protein
MTTVCMYRWPTSTVSLGKGAAVQEDRGILSKAIKNTSGWFQLSQYGQGRKPLVIIGTSRQVLAFFKHHAASGIENTVPELPHIYMGVSRYAPPQQIRRLTPFNDAALATTSMAVWTTAGPHMQHSSNVASAFGTLYDYARKVLRPGVEASPEKTEVFCVKFSCYQEPGMRVVGRRRVAFGAYENGIGLDSLFGGGEE